MKKISNNNTLKIVLMIISGLIFISCCVILIFCLITGRALGGVLSKTKLATYKSCEKYFKTESISYFDSHRVLYPVDKDVVISTEYIGECNPCVGYVIINAKEDKYDVYLSCDKYKTDKFDDKIYNDVIQK